MKKVIFTLLWVLAYVQFAFAQQDLLQAGPMVGYSEMQEVALWVQTKAAAEVHIEYWEEGSPKTTWKTDAARTQKAVGYSTHLIADEVEPGKKYNYALFINGKKVKFDYPLRFQTLTLWQYRTDPPPFTFAFGSCFFVNEERYDRAGKPYGGEYEIMKSIHEKKPDFMVWGGDNTYLREPDWGSRTGFLHRYTHTRSLPELQPLLGSTHHYATWDDHDYGPNNSDRSFAQKQMSTELFKAFWANPNYDPLNIGGIYGKFDWADAEFFLLDNRYHRTANYRKNAPERSILGKAQTDWLLDALAGSRATFKFIIIGGQFLNPADYAENHATFPEERAYLLEQIQALGIKGVIFLTGDRHHSVLMKMERYGTYPLYELTASPLTSGPYGQQDFEDRYNVEGTVYDKRNFALLEVTGPRKERVLTIRMMNVKGEEVWKQEIKASDLR